MPKLNPNTPTLMDGEVRLFKRKHSKVWQVAFTLDGRQVLVSSKKRILNDAVAAAREMYLDYRYHYASTLHKLQGSTYRDVHLDLQGLGMVDFDTVKRLVYVGLTRTSGDKVTVLL